MGRLLDVLAKANKYFCALLMATMVLVVFVNACLRYFFNSGIIMGEELVRFLTVWSVFLAVITVYRERRHIAVTTLTDRLPPRGREALRFIANFGALYALYILCVGGLSYFRQTTTLGQATGLPYKVVVFPAILASLCCFGVVAADMANQLRRFLRGRAG